MNNHGDFFSRSDPGKFQVLKKACDRRRETALKKRLSANPQPTETEYILGAFMEMYEPHLRQLIMQSFEKGYMIDTSSGFGGKDAEFQVMSGMFVIDYFTRNRLEKLGVKFREYNSLKSLIFWPEKANLNLIIRQWETVVNALADKGKQTESSVSSRAVSFRRKYVPADKILRRERLFEKLKFETLEKVKKEVSRRLRSNIPPDKIEKELGLFLEEIEPQLRSAIVMMAKKGYSTDNSGFMDDPCGQMVEGDFQIDDMTKKGLEKLGVEVETNPSGYTRLKFSPPETDISKIRKHWDRIVSFLPCVGKQASVSMTRKAREFRSKYG